MAGSLKDQLLKAGLSDEKKARQLDKEKRKQAKVAKSSGIELVNEAREAAQRERLSSRLSTQQLLKKASSPELFSMTPRWMPARS